MSSIEKEPLSKKKCVVGSDDVDHPRTTTAITIGATRRPADDDVTATESAIVEEGRVGRGSPPQQRRVVEKKPSSSYSAHKNATTPGETEEKKGERPTNVTAEESPYYLDETTATAACCTVHKTVEGAPAALRGETGFTEGSSSRPGAFAVAGIGVDAGGGGGNNNSGYDRAIPTGTTGIHMRMLPTGTTGIDLQDHLCTRAATHCSISTRSYMPVSVGSHVSP